MAATIIYRSNIMNEQPQITNTNPANQRVSLRGVGLNRRLRSVRAVVDGCCASGYRLVRGMAASRGEM